MSKETSNRPSQAEKKDRKNKVKMYERFHWTQRIAHAILFTSFTLLALTGLPQKYPLSDWGQFLVKTFGGIETTRLIHHVCAVILMFLTIYHLLDIGYKILVRRVPLTMLPGVKDIRDALQAFGYNLGIVKERPQMGRYSFEEKMEYWALVWGIAIMGLTGFMMWNPIATTKILPGEIVPAAKAAHGGEALLAVAAIVIWHMYGVHIKRFNKSMFTGKMSEEEMLHEHPLELAEIKAGTNERPIDPITLRWRQTIYWPIAGVVAATMLFGVYAFIGLEKTALPAAPKNDSVPIYLPQTPTPLPSPTATASVDNVALTWEASIGPMLQKCILCHGTVQPQKGVSLITYADAMRGGESGPILVSGNAEESLLIQVQSQGNHPGQLSPEEIERLRQWIDAGAPEK